MILPNSRSMFVEECIPSLCSPYCPVPVYKSDGPCNHYLWLVMEYWSCRRWISEIGHGTNVGMLSMQLEWYVIDWQCQRFDAERAGLKEFNDMETTSENASDVGNQSNYRNWNPSEMHCIPVMMLLASIAGALDWCATSYGQHHNNSECERIFGIQYIPIIWLYTQLYISKSNVNIEFINYC